MLISYLSLSIVDLIITTTLFICPNPNPRVSPIANHTITIRAVVSKQVVSRQCQVELEEDPLAIIEEILSSEYKLETESNTGSVLLAQLLQPTLLPLTLLSLSPLLPYTIS